ncbi:MAG: nucleotide sugar dehydrogenase, partial [Candidatus Bathyarchaeia archaeon]
SKKSIELTPEKLKTYDCVLIATDHSSYDPQMILENSNLIVDTRNLIKNLKGNSDKVVKA